MYIVALVGSSSSESKCIPYKDLDQAKAFAEGAALNRHWEHVYVCVVDHELVAKAVAVEVER